jgi:predicted TIM-barrel fold metal-dependent hydrolase
MRAGELESLERIAARVQRLGWHVQLHLPGTMIPQIAGRLLNLPVDFVVDHFGRMDAWQGVVQPAFQALLRLVDSGRCWVKLSAPYRMDGAPYPKVAPFARELVKRNPQRMLWGTDWPHPDVAVVPEDPGLLATLFDWVPDDKVRHRILVENPAKLYRF